MLLIVMHTELSSPKVKSIRKNMMDQKGAAGSVAMAAGYTTKTRPGPTNQIFDIQYEQFCMKDLGFFFKKVIWTVARLIARCTFCSHLIDG